VGLRFAAIPLRLPAVIGQKGPTRIRVKRIDAANRQHARRPSALRLHVEPATKDRHRQNHSPGKRPKPGLLGKIQSLYFAFDAPCAPQIPGTTRVGIPPGTHPDFLGVYGPCQLLLRASTLVAYLVLRRTIMSLQ